MKDLKILIACEESQMICKAFRKLGYETYNCDLQECSGGHPEWHIQENVLSLLKGHCQFKTQDGIIHSIHQKWDLIVAHPPCTYMSKAGARWMFPKAGQLDLKRYEQAMDAKKFFMEFINADCDHIVIENPTPLKIVDLPKPTQIIQPYQFGDPYSKRTLLWIKGLPKLVPTNILDDFVPWMPSNTGGLARGKGGSRGIAHDAKTGSKTFPGIADAIATQYSKFLEEE